MSKYRVSFAKEKKEYIEIKKHNKTFNFNSIQSYMTSRESNPKFIQNPQEYFEHIFINWYDFLQVNTDNFIQDKNKWIKFCKDKNVKSVDDYYNLCQIYNFLPKEPIEFYKSYTNLGHELGWYKKRRYL